MGIFAIRKPDSLKGVFVTSEGIDKARESVKGVAGASFRDFEDKQGGEAVKWASVKGFSDNPQMAVYNISESEPRSYSKQDRVAMSEGETFLHICDEFKSSGYNFLEVHFTDRVVGVFLESAAFGEVRKSRSDQTEAESVKYSMDNRLLKVVMNKTSVSYMEPFLILKDAAYLEESGTDKIPHMTKKGSYSGCISMKMTDIVDIKAYSYVHSELESYNTSRRNIEKVTRKHIELYKQIKPFLQINS